MPDDIDQPTTLMDILAEKQTNERGNCPKCGRLEVPVNVQGICGPCAINPDWRQGEPKTLKDLFAYLTATRH